MSTYTSAAVTSSYPAANERLAAGIVVPAFLRAPYARLFLKILSPSIP
jgi:hypothetical protein